MQIARKSKLSTYAFPPPFPSAAAALLEQKSKRPTK